VFEGARFHIWQFVLPSFSRERQLLSSVAAVVSRAHTLVTFNGRSFDVPFLDTRWLYHRLNAPLGSLRHLDLLHVARRVWGPETGGLGGLEDRVLGFCREGDVAGFEIPSRYFDYLRSGDPSPLRRVLLHNQLDLASLGVFAGLACDLIDQGPSSASDPRQCLGLGRSNRTPAQQRHPVTPNPVGCARAHVEVGLGLLSVDNRSSAMEFRTRPRHLLGKTLGPDLRVHRALRSPVPKPGGPRVASQGGATTPEGH
jgi:hypothetical protein